MIIFVLLLLAGMIDPVFAQTSNTLPSTSVALSNSDNSRIGFDDMVFSAEIHKVLVPAGHTGKLYLIDSESLAMSTINGFTSSPAYEKGHKVGVSSADEGEGFIFAADHGNQHLDAVDLASGKILAYATLSADADYVRYIASNHEIWVTEPDKKQIEIFKFSSGNQPNLASLASIPVTVGSESLIIDHVRGHAYTNLGSQTATINIISHSILNLWPNQCEKSRGDALDEQRGFLFVSCKEGKVEVFDINQGDKKISELTIDSGADVISYNPKLGHLYLTSSTKATLSILGVTAQGELSLLSKSPAALKAHCVVGDDQNNIWVCDPPHGKLLRYKDS